jgi:hypothetical protein
LSRHAAGAQQVSPYAQLRQAVIALGWNDHWIQNRISFPIVGYAHTKTSTPTDEKTFVI